MNTDQGVFHHCHSKHIRKWTLVKRTVYVLVVDFKGGRFAPCAVEVIQLTEGALGPNAEAADVSTWSELQQV